MKEPRERNTAQADRSTLDSIVNEFSARETTRRPSGELPRAGRSTGAIALFVGAAGTGKTIAAENIAREINRELLRVNLRTVVSKYIGETEKNLARIIAKASSTNAVLLLEEADSLFGKRSEVKDSHDRYANTDASSLLERIESYEGLALLTTNQRSNLDTAFLRRLRFVIDFPTPLAPTPRGTA